MDTLADDPPGLRVDLMRHQQRALAWMQWREQQKPSAGILGNDIHEYHFMLSCMAIMVSNNVLCLIPISADDMGLGKTLAMLSLVLSRKSESPKEPSEWMKKSTEGQLMSSCSVSNLVPRPFSQCAYLHFFATS